MREDKSIQSLKATLITLLLLMLLHLVVRSSGMHLLSKENTTFLLRGIAGAVCVLISTVFIILQFRRYKTMRRTNPVKGHFALYWYETTVIVFGTIILFALYTNTYWRLNYSKQIWFSVYSLLFLCMCGGVYACIPYLKQNMFQKYLVFLEEDEKYYTILGISALLVLTVFLGCYEAIAAMLQGASWNGVYTTLAKGKYYRYSISLRLTISGIVLLIDIIWMIATVYCRKRALERLHTTI